MDEGQIEMKDEIVHQHDELFIKDGPIVQSSVLPSTEKTKVEKSDLRVRKWACSVQQCSNKVTN